MSTTPAPAARKLVTFTQVDPQDVRYNYGTGSSTPDDDNGWLVTFTTDWVIYDEPVLVTWQWKPEDGYQARIHFAGDKHWLNPRTTCDLGKRIRTAAGLAKALTRYFGPVGGGAGFKVAVDVTAVSSPVFTGKY